MKINPIISAITSAAICTGCVSLPANAVFAEPDIYVKSSHVQQSDPQTPKTYKLSLAGPDGNVFRTLTVNANEFIDYSKIDTSVLHKHIDKFTEQEFSAWSSTPETISEDTTIQALVKTAKISVENLPYRSTYATSSGNILLDGLKITITVSVQKPEKDSSGKFKEDVSVVDIASTCAASPATIEEAFADGDTAEISIVPIGQQKSICSYTINQNLNVGDADGNGAVDGSDATLILKYYAESTSVPNYSISKTIAKNGDINCDGAIDGSDATIALQFYSLSGDDPTLTMSDFLKSTGRA